MEIRYTSPKYDPVNVTGRYIRCQGEKGSYRFLVIEAASGPKSSRMFAGKPGMGPTLREYLTDGAEIPEDVKARAIASKSTEKWD